MYVADWVETWEGAGKGRIYRLADESQQKSEVVQQVKEFMQEGFSSRSNDELIRLLAHPHLKIRQEAQFALAARNEAAVPLFVNVAAKNDSRLARLHAIWGLGQIGRKQTSVLNAVLPLLQDADGEVRAQTAKVLGEARLETAADKLESLLNDAEPRVQFFAAQAYGRMASRAQTAPILELIRDNADRDPYLRHAAAMALSRLVSQKELAALTNDPSPAVRMGVLLALRRQESPEAARFLDDSNPQIVDEAARAINDVPIAEAMPQLAALAGRRGLSASTLYRVINANFRLGTSEAARSVASIAADADAPAAIRVEATSALGDWEAPSGRDRVMGLWRQLPKRDPQLAAAAFATKLAAIFAGPEQLQQTATKVAVKLEVKEVGPVLLTLLSNKDQPSQTRVDALEALSRLQDAKAPEAIKLALADTHADLRVAGRRALARTQPEAAVAELKEALATGELIEKQSALGLLAEIKGGASADILVDWLDKALRGEVAPEIQLDLIEAAGKRPLPQLQERLKKIQAANASDDPLAHYRVALAGGNAERGRKIFFERSELSCVRCHKIAGQGGEVGPDLSKIGGQQKRDYLLEAIVLPDKQIAKGFDPVVLVTESGKVHAGIIKGDDGKEVRLMTADGTIVVIPKSEIEEQVRGHSSMPEDLIKKMSRSDLRDLVEFLAGLR
jgi:quinoprotein glucose dehydrogenase